MPANSLPTRLEMSAPALVAANSLGSLFHAFPLAPSAESALHRQLPGEGRCQNKNYLILIFDARRRVFDASNFIQIVQESYGNAGTKMGPAPYTRFALVAVLISSLIFVGRDLFTLSFEGPRTAPAFWRTTQSKLPCEPRNRGSRRMVPAHSMHPGSGRRR